LPVSGSAGADSEDVEAGWLSEDAASVLEAGFSEDEEARLPEGAAEEGWLWDGLPEEDCWLHPANRERAVIPAKTKVKNLLNWDIVCSPFRRKMFFPYLYYKKIETPGEVSIG
jgi:hypothetical protein